MIFHPRCERSAAPPTEVGQFELAPVVDEQVLGLQVPVEDFPLVAVGQAAQQLVHEDLGDEIAMERSQSKRKDAKEINIFISSPT